MSTIAENIANIRARMNEAAKKAGRDPSEILLCAATKMNDADRVKEAVAAGVDCCGENRVQEIQAKRPLGAYTGKPLHFIGHLQTNKVKYLVGVLDLIESVDRLELLECIEKQAEKVGVVQNILFEVNIGAEEETLCARYFSILALRRKKPPRWPPGCGNFRMWRSRDSWQFRRSVNFLAKIADISPKCGIFLLT